MFDLIKVFMYGIMCIVEGFVGVLTATIGRVFLHIAFRCKNDVEYYRDEVCRTCDEIINKGA